MSTKGFTNFLLENALDSFIESINGGTAYVLSRFGEPLMGMDIPEDWLVPHKSSLVAIATTELEFPINFFRGVIKGYDIYNTLGGLRPKVFTFRNEIFVEKGDIYTIPSGEFFRIEVK